MKNDKIIRDSEVLRNKVCERINYFDSHKLSSNEKKGINYYLSQVLEDELIYLEPSNVEDVYNSISENYEVLFEEELEVFVDSLNRMKNYMRLNNIHFIEKISRTIFFENRKILVSAFIFKNIMTGELMLAKIKNKKPELSYRSRKGNKPEDNVELLMLRLLGEQEKTKFPEHNFINPYLIYLRGRRDKGDVYPLFEEKPGDNMIMSNHASELAIEELKELAQVYKLEDAEVKDLNFCSKCPYFAVCKSRKAPEIKKVEKDKEVSKNKKKEIKPTPDQEKVINFKKGVARVNAGAGTGKTFILVNRIKKLIDEGEDPEKMLLITFTNKGADEMRQRLRRLTEESEKVTIETFNSFGAKLIEENYKEWGYEDRPKLLSKRDQYNIIIELLKDPDNDKIEGLNYAYPFLNFRYSKGAVARLAELFDIFKENEIMFAGQFFNKGLDEKLLSSEKSIIAEGYPFIDKVFDLYLKYNKTMKDKNLIDYTDQILIIIKAIRENHKVLKDIEYEHIIVDEYQDTDEHQLEILQYFQRKKGNKSLMVVGDDSQSIYQFRGARPDIIIHFDKYFQNVESFNIVENFRSTKEIISLANEVNSWNSQRVDKKLIAKKEGTTPIFFDLDIEELLKIVDFDKAKNPNKSTAIITRSNYELMYLKEELDKLDIPSVIQTPLIENPNTLLFKQILDFLIDGESTVGIFNYLFVFEEGFMELSKEEKEKFLEEYTFELKKEFPIAYTFFDDEGNIIDGEKIKMEFLDEIVENMKDIELRIFYEEMKEEELNLEEMKKLIEEMILFEDRRIVDIPEEYEYEGIILITAHSSKGKEYDTVYCVSNKFKPSDKKDQRSIDEEVRLLFVAITRAKEELYIIGDGNSFFYDKLANSSNLQKESLYSRQLSLFENEGEK